MLLSPYFKMGQKREDFKDLRSVQGCLQLLLPSILLEEVFNQIRPLQLKCCEAANIRSKLSDT